MPIPLPINPSARPTRPAIKKRAVPEPADETFDPKAPFESYKRMLKSGPPSKWTPDKRGKWQEDMQNWFAKNFPGQMA